MIGTAYAVKEHIAIELLDILDKRWRDRWNGYFHFDSCFQKLMDRMRVHGLGKAYSIFPPMVIQRKTRKTNSYHHKGFYDHPAGFVSLYDYTVNKWNAKGYKRNKVTQ